MLLSTFNTNDLRTLSGKLYRVDPLMTGQIQQPQTLHWPSGRVRDNLQDTAQLDLIAMYSLSNCIQITIQVDVRGNPRTEFVNNRLLLHIHQLEIHSQLLL